MLASSTQVCLRPAVSVLASAVTFTTLYPAPLFEVLSLAGFEPPFVLYPAQYLCMVWCTTVRDIVHI